MKKFSICYFAAFFAAVVSFGCTKPQDDKETRPIAVCELPVVEIKSENDATIVLQSDYSAGSYGVISGGTYKSKAQVDSDADLGFADGNFYVLERRNQGKLTFLSPKGEILRQIPFEISAFFNPHGVCGDANGKIFVGSYEDAVIAVFEKQNDDVSYKTIIDLSAQKSAVGQTKLQDIKFFDGKIYAAFQELDNNGWYPAEKSKILEVDPSNGAVLRTFESGFMNVLQIEIRANDLFVLDICNYSADGAGITKINLANGEKQTVLDGASVGAAAQKMEFISDNEAYVLMLVGFNADYSPNSYVARLNLSANTLNSVEELANIKSVSAISYNKSEKTLYVAGGNKVFKY